jgi:hypothetical protein
LPVDEQVVRANNDHVLLAPSFPEKAIVLWTDNQDASCLTRSPPMPVSINNSLPNIVFPLSNGASTIIELVALFDTCCSLNSGDTTFHLWLAASYPDIVHEILFANGPEGFDPIKLMGAIKSAVQNSVCRFLRFPYASKFCARL